MFVFQHISIWLIFPVNWRHDSLPSYRDFLSALRAGVVLWLDCFRDMFVLLHQLDHVFQRMILQIASIAQVSIIYGLANHVWGTWVTSWQSRILLFMMSITRYEVALQRSGWRYRIDRCWPSEESVVKKTFLPEMTRWRNLERNQTQKRNSCSSWSFWIAWELNKHE